MTSCQDDLGPRRFSINISCRFTLKPEQLVQMAPMLIWWFIMERIVKLGIPDLNKIDKIRTNEVNPVNRSLLKARTCDYTKELAALLKDYNKSYDYYLPEFDFENDQLIMDFRDSGTSYKSMLENSQVFFQYLFSIKMACLWLNLISLLVSMDLAKNSIFMSSIHHTRQG